MSAHGLDRRLARAVLAIPAASSSPRRVVWTFAALAAGLSMWVSNSATTEMLFPIALGVLGTMDGQRGRSTPLARSLRKSCPSSSAPAIRFRRRSAARSPQRDEDRERQLPARRRHHVHHRPDERRHPPAASSAQLIESEQRRKYKVEDDERAGVDERVPRDSVLDLELNERVERRAGRPRPTRSQTASAVITI